MKNVLIRKRIAIYFLVIIPLRLVRIIFNINRIFSICLFIGLKMVAQTGPVQPQPVVPHIPPSPEAMSFQIYGDHPVSHYTGLVNIEVPIYDIMVDEVHLPIKLSYHASGIKVNQTASNVGLGWTLNATGVITRTVNGIPDEESFGILDQGKGYGIYYPTLDQIDYSEESKLGPHPETVYLIDVKEGRKDSESDLYTLNCFGLSTNFIMDADGNAHCFPNTNLKIIRNINGNEWTVYDITGTTYIFSEKEQTSNIAITEFGDNYGDPASKDGAFPRVTGWYLTKIITSKGNIIDFEYGGTSTTVSFSASESAAYLPTANINNYYKDRFSFLSQFKIRYSVPVLNAINFPNGAVEFTRNGTIRQDVPDGSNLLGTINVINSSGDSIKRFKPTFDYFLADDSRCSDCSEDYRFKRLKLIGIQEFGSDNNWIPPYVFEYYEAIDLPAIDSFDQDYWGYYNGKVNNHQKEFKLIPAKNHLQQFDRISFDYQGAYREPRFPEMQAWTLNKIKYPTGGQTRFEYEPHSYFVPSGSSANDEIREINYGFENSSVVETNELLQMLTYTKEFTVPGVETYPAQGNITMVFGNSTGGKDDHIVEVRDMDTNAIVYSKSYSGNGTTMIDPITLVSGKSYIMGMTSNIGYPDIIDIDLSYTYRPIDGPGGSEKIAGGLRTGRTIAQESMGSRELVKEYRYINSANDNSPSGSVKQELLYCKIFIGQILLPTGGCGFDSCLVGGDCDDPYITIDGGGWCIPLQESIEFFSSVPYNGLGLTRGSSVGYGAVEEWRGTIENHQAVFDNGHTVFGYSVPTDRSYIEILPQSGFVGYDEMTLIYMKAFRFWKEATFFPNHNPGSKDWEEGLLIGRTIMDNLGEKVSQEINHYTYNVNPKVLGKGIKIGESPYMVNFDNNFDPEDPNSVDQGLPLRYNNVLYEAYSINSDRVRLDSTEVIHYSGPENLTTTEKYFYNEDFVLLDKVATRDSKAGITIVDNYYPFDLPGGIFQIMVNDHFLPVVKKTSTRNGLPIKGTEGYYREGTLVSESNRHHFVMDSIAGLKNNSWETKYIYDRYDDRGNLLQFRSKDGIPITFLWGHDKQYVIAQIQNATYNEVATALNVTENVLGNYGHHDLSSINTLRVKLPDAQVSTYYYAPLIGMTKMIDPMGNELNYKYDEFKRLKEIRDTDNILIEDYKYHYDKN